MSARWTIDDKTTPTGGYLALLLDGKVLHIDAFPHAKGADEQRVREQLKCMVDCLNGKDCCLDVDDADYGKPRAYDEALAAAINTGLGAVMMSAENASAPLQALCVEIRSTKDKD